MIAFCTTNWSSMHEALYRQRRHNRVQSLSDTFLLQVQPDYAAVEAQPPSGTVRLPMRTSRHRVRLQLVAHEDQVQLVGQDDRVRLVVLTWFKSLVAALRAKMR